MFGPHGVYRTSHGLSDFTGKHGCQKKSFELLSAALRKEHRLDLVFVGILKEPFYDLSELTGPFNLPLKAS